MLVEVSVNMTLASPTRAPEGSVTDPTTVPVDVDCAQAADGLPNQRLAEQQRRKQANRQEKTWRRTRIASPPTRTTLGKRSNRISCLLEILTTQNRIRALWPASGKQLRNPMDLRTL
jgi:hypothetical protein